MADSSAAKTLYSILVDGWWTWGVSINCKINFKADGTGEVACIRPQNICLCLAFYPKLACGVGLSMCIAAIFDWEPLADRDVLSLKQIVVDHGDDIPPVDIALTLTECWMMPGFEQLSTTIAQEAFRSKTYTIRFEMGNFPVIDETSSGLCGWYSPRLRIDPSPYPPLEQ
jgi:hypothetical protein